MKKEEMNAVNKCIGLRGLGVWGKTSFVICVESGALHTACDNSPKVVAEYQEKFPAPEARPSLSCSSAGGHTPVNLYDIRTGCRSGLIATDRAVAGNEAATYVTECVKAFFDKGRQE